ncbi:unnamed protein product [Rotaria sp. Silwood1]|nr:unnamed protein product [Rotaria sp. Silwood1]CAF3430317.1 unnamed protein product [Rotaria sp. Silwood1]CAF3445635.1 unnamed protein product [Rotaria sp. Silwood1]CAF4529461.1 unnamed protein product [Rotaria sp. Silwood1]CAF4670976.1 unnamed protein product [Rotaria sp. Silwood1]
MSFIPFTKSKNFRYQPLYGLGLFVAGCCPDIHNIGIALKTLLDLFSAPENSQATVIALIVSFLSPHLFYLVLINRLIRRIHSKIQSIIRYTSIDILSKSTFELSEPEAETFDDISQIKKKWFIININLRFI